MSRRTVSRALMAVALSVSLAACGDSDGGSDASASSSPSEPSAQACETVPPTATPAEGLSTDLAQKPEPPATDAAPPCGLVISDIVVGTGAEAVDGSTAAVKYVGTFYESGEEFDSSWSRSSDETIEVPLGAHAVVPGFEQGIVGMKVGGRRMITIPSDLGYGPDGRPPVIPGNSTLVFVMDLVEVTP
jgi:FKBP-type peptidyl-prolyl cis-trans isomerase